MSENITSVRTPEQVIDMLAAGELSPAEAFHIFREIDAQQRTSGRQTGKPQAQAAAESDADRAARLEVVMSELDALIGLKSVKRLVKEIQAFVDIQQRRMKEHLVAEPLVLHMIFKGNPGTGKTTVARILGRMLKEMGVLPKGHLIEVERADLVGEYIGHTAQKTREQLRKAMGGILFIDEAYSLARGGEKDFGKEAIDTLVKAMEDHKAEMILILAGYRDEMEFFLRTNPGLRSRFPIHIQFPDYQINELMAIADQMLKARQYKLTTDARRRLQELLQAHSKPQEQSFGNARLVRNLIEKGIRRQAVRLVKKKQMTRDDLMLIRSEDIEDVSEA